MKYLCGLLKLLPHFIVRDIRERYVESTMGLFWAVIQPVALVLMYWFVFSYILQFKIHSDTGEIPFALYLLTGMIPWFVFQSGVSSGAASIVQKRDVITKVVIPAELFPLASVISTAAPFAVVYLCMSVFLQASMGEVSVTYLGLVVVLLMLQLLMMCGIAFILSALSVYLRDILQMLEVGLPILMFTAPVLYPLSMVPDKLSLIIFLNPYTPFVVSYQKLILFGELPGLALFSYVIFISVATFVFGALLFTKLKRGFADVL